MSPGSSGSARAAMESPKLVLVARAISDGSAPMSRASTSRVAASPANRSRSGSRCGAVRLALNSSSARRVRSGMGPMEALLK